MARVIQTFDKSKYESISSFSQVELDTLRSVLGWNEYNAYAAALFILAHGYDALPNPLKQNTGVVFKIAGANELGIEAGFYKKLIDPKSGHLYNCGLLAKAKSSTPAGKSGHLNSLGQAGKLPRLMEKNANSISGKRTHLPPNCAAIIEQANVGWANDIADACEAINSHSWMTNTAVGSFGGITEALHYITGAVTNFQQALLDLYMGMKLAMLQAQLFLNHIIGLIEDFLVNKYLGKGLPLLLIITIACLVLSSIQTLIDDVAFFGSLFDGSDQLYQVLNVFQKVVNIGSEIINVIEHPITVGVAVYVFPKQAKGLQDFINNLGKIPEQFLSSLLQGFNTKRGNNSAIAIANAIIAHYGLGAQLGDLNPILQSFGTAVPTSTWNRVYTPGVMGGNLTKPISFYPKNVPYGLLSKVNPALFSIAKYGPDGVPEFTLDGAKNSLKALAYLPDNPLLKQARKDLGTSGDNVRALTDLVGITKRNFGTEFR